MARPMPSPDVPIVDITTGKMTTPWFDYLASRDKLKLTELSDVSTTAPANGQVAVWVAATSKWTPAAN